MLRWTSLFDDLEGQLEQELGADEVDLLAEEERLRIGRLTLRERLRAMTGGPAGARVSFHLRNGDRVPLTISAIGRDWLAGEVDGGGSRSSGILPLAAIATIAPSDLQLEAGLRAIPPESPTDLSPRLGLPFVLRDLCRRRSAVDLILVSGRLHGTIDRVGRDHLDVAEHPAGEPRRSAAVTRVLILALDDLLLIRF